MNDISNEGLLNNVKNKKSSNMFLFDSISEKQEESSNSSYKNSKIIQPPKSPGKTKKKSILKTQNHEEPKDSIDMSRLSIRKKKLQSSKKKSIKIIANEEDKEKYEENLRVENKKKTSHFFAKRTSFQRNNFDLFLNQLKNNEEEKKRSSKNIDLSQIIKNPLKEKRSLNVTMKNKPLLSGMYNKNSIFGQNSLKNKNENLSNSDMLDMKYFNNKKIRGTILTRGKLNFREQKELHSSHLFEKLRDSYLFEKSEALLFKIKICYGFLAVFSFLSILLEIIDVIIYNGKTSEYLEKNYNISIKKNTDIKYYYFIEKREITNQENTIRIFNSIFSVLCFIIHLILHCIKNNFNKQSKKKKNNKGFYRRSNSRRKTTKSTRSTKTTKEDNKGISNDLMKIVINEDFVTKNYVTREEIIKLILNCIISLVFFPPRINKIIVGIQHNILYAISLNSIFLLITFFKIINIYFALFYLSPFNNLLYKTICSSNMIKMDFRFMFKFILNLYPFSFIVMNFIILSLVVCILLYSFEFFTININNGLWNNKGENDLKNFYNLLFFYSFFVLKTIHGNIKAETILGSLIILVGGSVGLFISSYLIFYISQILGFRPEEQEAFTKLEKLLSPLNNEHKASNLIKVFLSMKKIYIDNRNIEKLYLIKKEKMFKLMVQKNFGFRKSYFDFDLNDSNHSLSSYVENNDYKEKKKFLKFIGSKFVLKTQIINECKNYKNTLLIARNNALSINDVLKTVGDKMNGNINQVNNKIEVLIQNDVKFRNFMKVQDNTVKKIGKINNFQKYILNYLMEINNEMSIGYISANREMQNKFLSRFKKAISGNVRRLRSSCNGPFFNFGKKNPKKKDNGNDEKKSNKKINALFYDKEIIKIEIKKMKSSVMGNKSNFYPKIDVSRSKTNPIKTIINKNKNKSKSFDDTKLKIYQERNINIKLESNIITKFKRKARSLSGKKKILLDKWKNKFEKIKSM